MYKWIEEDGSVTYSNQPPSEPAKVKELTKIESPPAPATVEAPVAKPEVRAVTPETAIAKPEAPAPMAEPQIAKPQPAAPKSEVTIVRPERPGASPEIIMVQPPTPAPKPEAPRPDFSNLNIVVVPARPEADASGAIPAPEPERPRRVIRRPTHTEAVQDPCLTSSDPKCPERYSSHYTKYGGYSPVPRPQLTTPAAPPVIGATSGGGAGGSVAKSVVAPPNWVAPKPEPTTSTANSKRKRQTQTTAGVR